VPYAGVLVGVSEVEYPYGAAGAEGGGRRTKDEGRRTKDEGRTSRA
jgi:hypothetical protein